MKLDNIKAHIATMQEQNPCLLLCGSAALIMSGALPMRAIGDIDFVINHRDLDSLKGFQSYSRDPYPKEEHDGYQSYHASWYSSYNFFSRTRLDVNLLVFDNEIILNRDTAIYTNMTYNIQKVDDILHWKQEYNREKDKEDMELIVTKSLEETLLS